MCPSTTFASPIDRMTNHSNLLNFGTLKTLNHLRESMAKFMLDRSRYHEKFARSCAAQDEKSTKR